MHNGPCTPYLCVQVQVCKISIADGRHGLTVHREVHLPTVALDGDIVPVEVVQQAAHRQRDPPVHFVYDTASCERGGRKETRFIFFNVKQTFKK